MKSKFQNNRISNNIQIFDKQYLENILDEEIDEAIKDFGLSFLDFEELVDIQLSRNAKTIQEKRTSQKDKVTITKSEIEELKKRIDGLNKLNLSELSQPKKTPIKNPKIIIPSYEKSSPITVELNILKVLINEPTLIPLLRVLKKNKEMPTHELLISMGRWGYGKSLISRATNLGLIQRKVMKEKSRGDGKLRIYNALTNKGREVVKLADRIGLIQRKVMKEKSRGDGKLRIYNALTNKRRENKIST